ncbi:MAG: hypothetical protein DHS20C09_20430 [marine bacterium B5-7]|nr:MAG: hypothetical protein DHS20C09_20430 [marine bacterium B5-7]
MRLLIVALLFSGFSDSAFGFGSGAGTCDVVADYSTITSMFSRPRNSSPGDYELSSNVPSYNSFEHVEITMTANGINDQSTFTGIVVSVVDENGAKVGTFNFDDDTTIRECGGSALMAATHTSTHGAQMSRTLFWIPPAEPVGDVYVLAYVLSGVRGNTSTQQFFRFVRDDDSALLIEQSDVIFLTGFE